VHKVSILEALPTIQADIAYFDPPYPGVMSYEKEYRIVDELLEGSSRPTSPFTAKDGAGMLDALFERSTHIPIWILSLGNAVVGVEELEAKMMKHGRKTKAIALRYQHLPAVATEEKKRENREFLVVGWDESSSLIRGLRERTGLGHKELGREIDRSVASVHRDLGAGSSERTAPETFFEDTDEKGSTPLAEQSTTKGRGLPLAVDHPGVHGPDTVFGEARRDGDSE
jgi:hypothetical protein